LQSVTEPRYERGERDITAPFGQLSTGDCVLNASRTLKGAALAGFLALACLVFGGGSRATAQVIDCTNGSPGPNMTIVI
jgi:hypothetical protein